MSIRSVKPLLALTALLPLLNCAAEPRTETKPPKHIVVVGVDTLRSDHLSGWGYERSTTPNLDQMAEQESVLFENAYSSSSWTLPSMASVFTSLHPMQHQVVDRGFRLDPSLATLAGLLSENGWRTAGFVTHIYVSSLFGLDSGFGDFFELSIDWSFEEGHQLRADALNREVFPWLSTHADEQFFVYIHFFDPHWDYDPPAPWSSEFTSPDYPGPATGSWAYLRDFLPLDMLMPEPALQRVIDLYDGEILWTDHQVGRLIEHLRSLGIWDDTLFVLLADHGEELQDHGSVHHIRTLYEEVLRVPLLVKTPGGREPATRSRVTERVSNLDIAPTILDFAGVKPDADFEGRSLRPLMKQSGRDRPIFAHTQRHLSDKATLIQDNLKVIHSWAPGEEGTELYDLDSDPDERTDLSALDPEETQRALDRLLGEIQRMRAWSQDRELQLDPTSLSPEQIEHLRALGYVD